MYQLKVEQLNKIKKSLNYIYSSLKEIPESRKIRTTVKTISEDPEHYIYRPRFIPSFKSLPREINNKILVVMDEIIRKFTDYINDRIKNLNNLFDFSKENKGSIVFLFENDIYSTHEVFGDYYVEKINDQYKIYNKRRESIRREIGRISKLDDIKQLIEKDAILQVLNQFNELWSQVIQEIDYIAVHIKTKLEDPGNMSELLVELLTLNECEFLDFKFKMYELLSKDNKQKIKERKEYLKDILGLVNKPTNHGERELVSYILIGVGEKNDIYDGTHRNIDFDSFQTLNQLLNEFITPKMVLDYHIYYISGDKNDILIENAPKPYYDRNLLLLINHEPGKVYEIKKKIGAPTLGICEYSIGTSFTRDKSHSRNLTQQDREKIIKSVYEMDYDYIIDYYQEIFSFLDRAFSNEELNFPEYNYYLTYISENLSELNHFFKISKNEISYYGSDETDTEVFFLKGKYGILFDKDLKPIIREKSGIIYSMEKYKENQKEAIEIYNRLKTDVKSLLYDDFEIVF